MDFYDCSFFRLTGFASVIFHSLGLLKLFKLILIWKMHSNIINVWLLFLKAKRAISQPLSTIPFRRFFMIIILLLLFTPLFVSHTFDLLSLKKAFAFPSLNVFMYFYVSRWINMRFWFKAWFGAILDKSQQKKRSCFMIWRQERFLNDYRIPAFIINLQTLPLAQPYRSVNE